MKEAKLLTKILASFTLLTFVFTLPAGASQLQTIKKKQKKIQQEMQNKQQEIKQKKHEYNATLGHLKNLEQDIVSVQGDLDNLKYKLNTTEKKLGKAEEELTIAEGELEERSAIFRNRLVEVYLNGQVSYLEVIFAATNMRDFLVRMDLLTRLLAQDMDLINEIDKKVAEIEEKKALIAQEKVNITKIKNSTESKERKLALQTEEKKQLLTVIETEKEAAEKAYNQLQNESNQIAAEIRKIQAASKRVRRVTTPNGRFKWPTPGYTRVTSTYGWRIHPILKTRRMHTGVDLSAPMGADMVASEDGTVIYSGWYGAYGNVVIIDHGDNISTMYAHMSKIKASEGKEVKAGQVIGAVGSTGWSTGPHAHYEVRVKGETVDPMSYLR